MQRERRKAVKKSKKSIILLCVINVVILGTAFIVPNIGYIQDEVRVQKFTADVKEIEEDYERGGFSGLYELNDDLVAYLSIPGTGFAYPVMQTKDEPEYYLSHDFMKEYSYYGMPFLDYRCDLDSSNLIIYGHNITGKRYFGYLTHYQSYEFYKKHSTISLETQKDKRVYEIIAVIDTDTYSSWYQFVSVKKNRKKTIKKWLNFALENSVYDCSTNTDIEECRQFLTLSTCGDAGGDKRLLVIAFKK